MYFAFNSLLDSVIDLLSGFFSFLAVALAALIAQTAALSTFAVEIGNFWF